MKVLPPYILGPVHFIGIGGIGMSGIAEVLHNLGYKVQGSEVKANANSARLSALGIPVMLGHAPENMGKAEIVVVSSAVKETNPELQAARTTRLPVVKRAEMLAELMRLKWSIGVAGTHGKTSTTTLIAHILEAARLDPTFIIGGVVNAHGTNARLGQGDWMVVETDESDGSFQHLPLTVGVVTNIDAEHMEQYGSMTALENAFARFLHNIPFYGFGVVCMDHPVVARLAEATSRRLIRYGFSEAAQLRALNVVSDASGSRFDVRWPDGTLQKGLHLPMHGQHYVQNALAAMAVARELQIAPEQIAAALSSFAGVKRRFTLVGEVNGIKVVDDYAHHPVEIAATLAAARSLAGTGKVIAVVQPHRYTRLAALFPEFCECFTTADEVLVADVYAAGEAPIAGADRDSLIKASPHPRIAALPNAEMLAPLVHQRARAGDVVVCMGAGNITDWAQALPAQLETLQKGAA